MFANASSIDLLEIAEALGASLPPESDPALVIIVGGARSGTSSPCR